MGVHPRPCGLLEPAHLDLADAGLPALWSQRRRAPREQRVAARRHGDTLVPGPPANDRRLLAYALAAALFAVHPLRVESVAWVTERKDVLSGLFFVLALGAYVSYVQRPFSVARYLAIMVFLALGLMAKPILVTLPLVLLLLDYWPLGRFAGDPVLHPTSPLTPQRTPPHCKGGDFPSGANSAPNAVASLLRRLPVFWQLVIEKLPLFLISAIFCGVTFWTQASAREANETFLLGGRIANALVSYAAYLGQFVYPVGLAVFYPHPGDQIPIANVLVAVLVLTLISAAVLCCRRRCPYLLMGWLWYLAVLAPVIGLVQAGWQARADRFTYLPQIGLAIALAWGAADVLRGWPHRGWLCGSVSALVLAVLMGCAWRQTCFWCDSETLWTHALTCTLRNDTAHDKLGLALVGRGQLEAAIAHYQKALEISPGNVEVHNNLSVALASRGRLDEAIMHCREALRIAPALPKPTTIWRLPCPAGAGSTRPSCIMGKAWKSSPVTSGRAASWAWLWPGAGDSTSPLPSSRRPCN